MNNEITYAFLDNNQRVFDVAILQEGDLETLNNLIAIKSAFEARPILNPEKELFELSKMYWDGTAWCYDSPYPSWVWDKDSYCWKSPVLPPAEPPKEGFVYAWNEDTISWEEVLTNK